MESKKYTLPKEFAERWVAALRSGLYKQSTAHLYNDNGYCCLGVACNLEDVSDEKLFGQIYPNFDWLPLEIKYNNLDIECATLNDHLGYSFAEIADWIEANVEFI